ncbi:MAG: hypothetical protein ACXWJZ_04730, partial [Burkholderiaceae bacterium]
MHEADIQSLCRQEKELDSPTFCRPRFGLQAKPFEIPRARMRALFAQIKIPACAGICILAEREGFEPPVQENQVYTMIIEVPS